MPMAFVVVAAILACFAVGYAELSRAVKGTGAFYTYIGRGLGNANGGEGRTGDPSAGSDVAPKQPGAKA
jgi:amino acid transporter